MKKLLLIVFIFCCLGAVGQTYQNSWIQYNQTYYKFTIGSEGVYRIPQSILQQAGLGNVPAETFQLWHNGTQQPIYITRQNGILSGGDYIEFYGVLNDGKPDTKLYNYADLQLSDHRSLITDSSSYFLTFSTNGTGLHFLDDANNLSGNTLAPEKYFMNKRAVYYEDGINPGHGIPVGGVYLYSSSYESGEGWQSSTIAPGESKALSTTIENLNLYQPGPPASFSYAAVGNAYNNRNIKVKFNSTFIDDAQMANFDFVKKKIPTVPISLFTSTDKLTVSFQNTSAMSTDRMVVTFWEVTYPSTFNFNNSQSFYFELPQAPSGNYLEITNFNSGSTAPVLYDLTSLRRYIGDISTPGIVRFRLPASGMELRKFRLVSESPEIIKTITSLIPRNFVDYSKAANQGNYIIISNPILYSSSSGKNFVQEYADYRSSAEGGGFKTLVVDIHEIEDQFAYGIAMHPLAVKDFIQFATSSNFSIAPQYVFIIGKGVDYLEMSKKIGSAYRNRMNLVPTFGSPASDNLLASGYGGIVTPNVPIGRLSAVSGEEVENYLEKIKEYESQQQSKDYSIENKLWNKNVVQIVGGKDNSENGNFRNYMYGYKLQLEDSSLGMHVETFSKTTTAAVQMASMKRIKDLFEEGIGILAYFGHSSATTLEFNLDDPTQYNNPEKYPVFIVSGCIAGNNFTYDSSRVISAKSTISENFVLSKQRGSIAFIASTHYGIAKYLNDYNRNLYDLMGKSKYGMSIGTYVQQAVKAVGGDNPSLGFYPRADAEEMAINGDPAIKPHAQPKPDYVVEDRSVKISPAFISISSQKFTIDVKTFNLGKAVGDSITWEVKRTLPDGTVTTVYRERISAPFYSDSILISVPIISSTDKGLNKLTITIDADNEVDEISEANNSITKEFYIFEDEATPIYPQNFGIINNDDEHLIASTADPFSPTKSYVFQLDTTEVFNSPIKVSREIQSGGGLIDFDPGVKYTDGTVYYWRVMVKTDTTTEENGHWNNASFIYMKNSTLGSNMSDYYQHLYSDTQRITLNTDRKWKFRDIEYTIKIKDGVYPTAYTQGSGTAVSVNDADVSSELCGLATGIIVAVLDPTSLAPWRNFPKGRFGSYNGCPDTRDRNFQYLLLNQADRINAYHFLKDSIPDGAIVAIRNVGRPDSALNSYASLWMSDTAVLGKGNSLYHVLYNSGFTDIDSFYRPRAFVFLYQKNVEEFVPTFVFSEGISDNIVLTHTYYASDSLGFIKSPRFGPATEWKELHWDGTETGPSGASNPTVSVIGITNSGTEDVLLTVDKSKKDVDISNIIDAVKYPYARLEMRNADSTDFEPYQLNFWRLNYEPAPEGGLKPVMTFNAKDTVEQGEPLKFEIAFQNISPQVFDSVKVKVQVIDNQNVTHLIELPRQKELVKGDTILLKFEIDTKSYGGENTLYVDFNPDNDQPELAHFNNFLYHNFYVRSDDFNPLLDVTFDGIHILNRDIVSARPHIVIKLEDENRFVKLSDTALMKVQLRYPNPNGPDMLRTIYFDNDTLQFTPATDASNAARIDFNPVFADAVDDEYELIVSGRDVAGNKSGALDYHVTFRVINKAMITELLNYPNPFTTSTAFVFTLTGSEVPQGLRIQIMTVTGKIVREVTKEELGPIHIGRNITEFKWDGTDMYGQRLANGVYLYRVLTNLNGKSLEKFNDKDYQLDPKHNFFRGGYGKMYLMR